MSKGRKTLIVIVGATATGKSDLAIKLAEHLNSEIISCDSRQFYREIKIGTAAPTSDQLSRVKHHFVGNRSITENYSAGQFELEALVLLEELFTTHDTAVMVGGSGLYINALCDGMDNIPTIDPMLREQLSKRLENEGLTNLLEQLRELDPIHYNSVDRSNPQRVIRALEVCLQTGQPYSSFRSGERYKRPFEIIKIGIQIERQILYERINRRVDQMIEEGLEEEARPLFPLRDINALQTVGYSELFNYFSDITSREEAIELIKRNSRRYAKRQQTWFRRDSEIEWFTNGENCASEIENWLKSSHNIG